MNLSVLVPSEDYKSFAGARIRYDRVAPHLADLGITLSLEEIGQFSPRETSADAVLLSKCHDARSLMAATVLRERGKLVGVDLFDDYFSQSEDSRLTRYRSWLADLVPHCDFALTSTKPMADVVREYRRELRVHVMNDPAPLGEGAGLSTLIAEKVRLARETGRIRLAWFGVGDNSYFPIGLRDLATCGPVLNELGRSGLDVNLTVLTNVRALDAEGLAIIGALPVSTRLEEWSGDKERAVLADALVALLPVNAQPFSVAKSLNRAVTALSAGCQVISTGYPLYDPFESLIYRDASTLLDDLARGTVRFANGAIEDFRTALERVASPEAEARHLGSFLGELVPCAPKERVPLTLVHGHNTRTEAHKMVRSLDGLSVASPFCTAPLDFDVLFHPSPTGIIMFVSRRASMRLLSHVQRRLRGKIEVRGEAYLQVPDLAAGRPLRRHAAPNNGEQLPIAFQVATYELWMREVAHRLQAGFGPSRVIYSETSPLFPSVGPAH